MPLLLQDLADLLHLFVFVQRLVVGPLRDQLAPGAALLLEADDQVCVGCEDDGGGQAELGKLHTGAADDALGAEAADFARRDFPGLHAGRHLRDRDGQL